MRRRIFLNYLWYVYLSGVRWMQFSKYVLSSLAAESGFLIMQLVIIPCTDLIWTLYFNWDYEWWFLTKGTSKLHKDKYLNFIYWIYTVVAKTLVCSSKYCRFKLNIWWHRPHIKSEFSWQDFLCIVTVGMLYDTSLYICIICMYYICIDPVFFRRNLANTSP